MVQATMAVLKEIRWRLKQAVKAKNDANVMLMCSLQGACSGSLWRLQYVIQILVILAVTAHASYPCACFFIGTTQKDFEGRDDPF